MMVCFGVGVVLCAALRIHLVLENRRRDRVAAESAGVEISGEVVAALDKTDKENPQFRYVY